MSGRRFLIAGLALLASVAAPGRAIAQHIPSPYRFVEKKQEATLFAGKLWSEPGLLGLGVDDSPIFGGSYTLRIGGPFNLEFTAAAIPTKRAVQDTVLPDTATFVKVGEADVTLGSLEAGIRFDLTGARTFHRVIPYLVTGVGLNTRITSDVGADSTVAASLRYRPGTRFAGHFGAGIEWVPSSRIGFKIDARDHLWRVRAPAGFLELSSEAPDKEWLQHYAVTAGLTYRF